MPALKDERQGWEQELREELPATLAEYQRELATPPVTRERREWLEWNIRRVQKRMVDVKARLAGSS